MEKEKKVQI